MRADRLLSIMLLLQVHRRMTARELADRLEVSERTIHRDMDALSGAGIPVFAERGSGGGWALMEEYRTNLTGLNREEIQALFLINPSRLLDDLGLGRASDAARIKLRAALPTTSRDEAEHARQRIYIDATGWNHSEEAIPMLPTLQEAVWKERKLHISYRRHGCPAVERLVDPLGLVAKGRAWYLVAAADGEPRSYRVSRVQDARVLDEPCVRPEGFDLASYWEQSTVSFKANLPRYQASVRVSPSVFPRMRYAGRFARIEQVDSPDEEGWVRVSIRFDVEEMACEYVLSFGSQMEVLEPDSLREKVIDLARGVIEFYDQRTAAPLARKIHSGHG
ncbi:MAG TPA: YafY family protein [Blastocatellia bacterium]|nr:YafY family protein [Blastocatellia bacterium]